MSGGREVLQPLADVQASVRQLQAYESSAELSEAVVSVAAASDAVLRRMVRADPAAPDELRLNALSAAGVPSAAIASHLRRRDVISLELAGMLHELDAAARRCAEGAVRASDADQAARTVARLTREAQAFVVQRGSALPSDSIRQRGDAVGAGGQDAEPIAPRRAAPRATGADAAEPNAVDGAADQASERRRTRRLMFIAGAVFMLGGLAMLFSMLRGTGAVEREAIAAFRAERYGVAEQGFSTVLEQEPGNVTAMLYLGRIYRVQGRMDEAAAVLSEASARAPRDPDAARELGHLFMDLRRPESAVPRFREAVELNPDDNANWIGLIQALRSTGDPTVDEWLQRAPAEVRAAMTEAPPQAPYRSP